jgi:hypothetical protein
VLAVLSLVVLLVAGAIALKFHRPKRSPMVGVQVGSEFVLHVEESGFFPQHYDKQGRPFRWTKGQARLAIPIDRDNPPHALWLHLWPYRSPNYNVLPFLRIVVNGHEFFHATVQGSPWKKTLDLTGLDLGDEVVVEIESDTFVPNNVKDGGPDTRSLGVMVMGVKLLDGDAEGE